MLRKNKEIKIIIFCVIFCVLIALLIIPKDGILAIDVSHHNRNVDAKVKKFAPQILIAKASEGANFKDPEFKHHFKISVENKLWFGAYHFFSFDKDVEAQFQNYLETVKISSTDCPHYRIDVKPILDVEDNPGKSKLGFKEMRRKVRQFGELCYK